MSRSRNRALLGAGAVVLVLGVVAVVVFRPASPHPAPPPAPRVEAPAPAPVAEAPKAEASKAESSDTAPETPEESSDESTSGKSVGKFTGLKAGVYLDGKPIAVLTFGELPGQLKPVWIEERVSREKLAGDKGPDYSMAKARRYRFTEYLTLLGVDLKKIKELHVYGVKDSDVIVCSGAELRSPKGRDFLFHFGSDYFGKPIPDTPDKFGNGKTPDKMTSVSIYVEKTPPKLIRNRGMALNGQVVKGIPYFGDPLRGGSRVYFDNRMVVHVKRRELSEEGSKKEPRWHLAELLQSRGLDAKKMAEGWIIQKEKRTRQLSAEELANAWVVANPQTKPFLQVGEEKLKFDALLTFTHALTAEERGYPEPRVDLGEEPDVADQDDGDDGS